MKPGILVLALLSLSACNRVETSCIATVPSTQLHEIYCGEEAPQSICFAEYSNGF